ncbi:hypothetical protein HA466_0203040 [Hirschfeldia incana]|nr:hypothetical protein HA466_0203040 [Hirschfeldia incana]
MDKEGTDVEHTHDLSNSRKGEKKRKKSTAHEATTNHSRKVKKVRASKKTTAHDATIGRLAATIEEAHDEIIELTEAIEEMTETMKKQQVILDMAITDVGMCSNALTRTLLDMGITDVGISRLGEPLRKDGL